MTMDEAEPCLSMPAAILRNEVIEKFRSSLPPDEHVVVLCKHL